MRRPPISKDWNLSWITVASSTLRYLDDATARQSVRKSERYTERHALNEGDAAELAIVEVILQMSGLWLECVLCEQRKRQYAMARNFTTRIRTRISWNSSCFSWKGRFFTTIELVRSTSGGAATAAAAAGGAATAALDALVSGAALAGSVAAAGAAGWPFAGVDGDDAAGTGACWVFFGCTRERSTEGIK